MVGRELTWRHLRIACQWGGLGLMLWLGGCSGQGAKAPETCPGKATVEEALATLSFHVSQARPLYINGQCRLDFVDEKGKERPFNLPVKLWMEPPFDMYMQGHAAPGPRGLVSLGSNQEEFWLSIRPEINTYWWGTWKEASQAGRLQISPRVVLEALGMVDFQDASRWRLENRDGRDVLSEVDASDSIVKQISVNPCDYLVYKIVYLDEFGVPRVMVDLDGYVKLTKTFSLPTRVRITNYLGGEVTDRLRLSLTRDGMQEKTFSERLRAKIFIRPKPRGYDKVIDVNKASHSLTN